MARAVKMIEETRAAWAIHGRDMRPVKITISRRLTRVKWAVDDPFKRFTPYLTQLAKEVRALRTKRARQTRRRLAVVCGDDEPSLKEHRLPCEI